MPINLRYGQQAVARGFLTSQRLQQVLAKQRQLAEQGKKVSVRMILEKAKLLDKDQLQQVDRDLNIKVVKKHTGKLQKPGVAQPEPTGAQNFAGEAPPQFAGMEGANPDATVFSPPPPDMQDKIRQEREKAKEEARQKQEQEAASFFNDDAGSPFGDDPFGGGGMAPEPMGGAEMAPEPMGGGEMTPEPMDAGGLQPDSGSPFGDDPFAQDMSPEPMGGEMQPEPMGGAMEPMGGGLQPDDGGFGDDSGSPFGDDPFADQGMAPAAGMGAEPAELDRLDSSPKLSSLPAEMEGFNSPEDEQLPTINAGFDEAGPPPAPQQQFAQPEPASADLAPDAGDAFGDFGNDIRSPEELESAPTGPQSGTSPLGGPQGGDMDATMFSPPPPGTTPGGRQKTGAMDRTVFSPRPPEFGGAQPMEAEPQGDDWGEEALPQDEPFGAEAEPFAEQGAPEDMDATVFSPPPPGTPGPQQPQGRQGADDFGDVELPTGKVIDDVPTAPASMDDDVHPIRRGVGTSSASVPQSQKQPVPDIPDEEVADELPYDDEVADEMPAGMPGGGPKLPKKGGLPGGGPGKLPKGRKELPQKKVPAAETVEEKQEKKKGGKRVLLFFVILLLIVLAILVLPVALYDQVPQVRQLRDNPRAKPIYDYVEEIYKSIPGVAPKQSPATGPNAAPTNAPDNTPGEAAGDTGEEAGETGEETGEESGDTGTEE